jgi:predicted signal transduction protein with EAL and GGDEF domain
MYDDATSLVNLLDTSHRRPALLLVDHHPINVQVLHQIFASDFQLREATTGERALAIGKSSLAVKEGLRRPAAADLVAHYGGDEFARILPETNFDDAIAVGREQRVRGKNIPHADSDSAPVVTISLGVAAWQADTVGHAGALLAEADLQLYSAKLAGRGRAYGAVLQPD